LGTSFIRTGMENRFCHFLESEEQNPTAIRKKIKNNKNYLLLSLSSNTLFSLIVLNMYILFSYDQT
jgi:CRISPR/Cas system CMR-associated protein Cmr3 (group 5 of RAMP superfamily)